MLPLTTYWPLAELAVRFSQGSILLCLLLVHGMLWNRPPCFIGTRHSSPVISVSWRFSFIRDVKSRFDASNYFALVRDNCCEHFRDHSSSSFTHHIRCWCMFDWVESCFPWEFRFKSPIVRRRDLGMDVSQASQGLGDPRLLEIIDKLVELNIGDSVALPQVNTFRSL